MSSLPTAKERRRLQEQGDSRLGELGRQFLAAGRWGEALECFEAAGDQEGLEEAARLAVEAGDLFTYRQALRLQPRAPRPQELEELARRAEAAGKLAYARGARELMASGEEGAQS